MQDAIFLKHNASHALGQNKYAKRSSTDLFCPSACDCYEILFKINLPNQAG